MPVTGDQGCDSILPQGMSRAAREHRSAGCAPGSASTLPKNPGDVMARLYSPVHDDQTAATLSPGGVYA